MTTTVSSSFLLAVEFPAGMEMARLPDCKNDTTQTSSPEVEKHTYGSQVFKV